MMTKAMSDVMCLITKITMTILTAESLLYFKQIVLVAGGNGELDRYDLLLSSTELYSPSSDSWTAGQNLPW